MEKIIAELSRLPVEVYWTAGLLFAWLTASLLERRRWNLLTRELKAQVVSGEGRLKALRGELAQIQNESKNLRKRLEQEEYLRKNFMGERPGLLVRNAPLIAALSLIAGFWLGGSSGGTLPGVSTPSVEWQVRARVAEDKLAAVQSEFDRVRAENTVLQRRLFESLEEKYLALAKFAAASGEKLRDRDFNFLFSRPDSVSPAEAVRTAQPVSPSAG
jgi:hypothetical protein